MTWAGFLTIVAAVLHLVYAPIGAAAMLPFCLLALLWFYIRKTNNVEKEPV